MRRPKKMTPQQRQKIFQKQEDVAKDLGYMTAAYFGGDPAGLELSFTDLTDRVYEVRQMQRRLLEDGVL